MKYLEVYDLLIESFEKEHLKRGDRLPSIRTLVDRYKVNKSTILKAYDRLEAEHKVYSVPKSGYYFLDEKLESKSWQDVNIRDVQINPKLLPYNEFGHAMNQAITKYQDSIFSYSETKGLESLRHVLIKHLQERHVYCRLEQLFVVSGAQQALSIMRSIVDRDHIVVEEPGYDLFFKLFEPSQLRPVKRLGKINFAYLETLFSDERVKYFYTMPNLHNPTGLTYSKEDKEKILRLASKHHVIIIEDDYIGDLNSKSLPMSHYDINDIVIYIKSFSKTFMPGNRVALVKVPKKYIELYEAEKRLADINTSLVIQGALEVYLSSGMYKRHIEKVRKYYQRKMNHLISMIKGMDMEGIYYTVPQTGLFIYFYFSQDVSISTLIKRLKSDDIIVDSSSKMYHSKPDHHGIRLCTAYYDEDILCHTICKLIFTIKELLNKKY